MFFVHTVAPLVSSIAITSLPVVTAKNRPLPPALAGAKYSGEAHMLPVNLAPVLNVASAAIMAIAALLNLGCTNKPSREALLLRSSTLSVWLTGGAPPAPPSGTLAPPVPALPGPLPLAPVGGAPPSVPEPPFATVPLPAAPGLPPVATGVPALPALLLFAPATVPAPPWLPESLPLEPQA